MKRGFTIVELLVASLLLGMLMTILTMIFNQSSIAWRTGMASVADLDDVRENIAEVREEADGLYVWKSDMYKLLSPWDESGNLRRRAIGCSGTSVGAADRPSFLQGSSSMTEATKPENLKTVPVGSGNSSRSLDTYTVNVKCAGPDREFNTWDDIWSFPDDPSEW